MGTAEKEEQMRVKLAALRDAVLNPAVSCPVAESLHQMFLSWADRFTAWHLRVLAFFDDPKAWFTSRGRQFPLQMMGSLSQALIAAFPELQNQRAFTDLIAKDLWNAGLINTDGLYTVMTASGTEASRTTDIGKQFLRFVTEPKPAK